MGHRKKAGLQVKSLHGHILLDLWQVTMRILGFLIHTMGMIDISLLLSGLIEIRNNKYCQTLVLNIQFSNSYCFF